MFMNVMRGWMLGWLWLAAGILRLDAAPPNIVFILVDDMGYGDIGCMGVNDIATPNIDRIAKEGVLMTDFTRTHRFAPRPALASCSAAGSNA
jgi:hypothetical protein